MSLRGAQRERRLLACARSRLRNLRVLVGMKADGEIAAASFGWPRNDMEKMQWTRNDIGKRCEGARCHCEECSGEAISA